MEEYKNEIDRLLGESDDYGAIAYCLERKDCDAIAYYLTQMNLVSNYMPARDVCIPLFLGEKALDGLFDNPVVMNGFLKLTAYKIHVWMLQIIDTANVSEDAKDWAEGKAMEAVRMLHEKGMSGNWFGLGGWGQINASRRCCVLQMNGGFVYATTESIDGRQGNVYIHELFGECILSMDENAFLNEFF